MKITNVTDATGITIGSADTDTSTSGADFASALSQELNQTQSLEDIFTKASDTYGVDVKLLKAMAKAESGFDVNATSSSGAMGIMQLMPQTAEYFGVTDAYDPEQNIMAGAKYISNLLEQYNGNVSYALAAYNAGSGNVDKYGGIPPFEETQNYVKKILGYLQENDYDIQTQYAAVTDASEKSSETSLRDTLEELFTREDYEAFLELFLERLTMRLNETEDLSVQSDEAEQESDAYIAYRNFGNTNRMAVYLKPTETI